MTYWEREKTLVAMKAPCYGPLALTEAFGRQSIQNYRITHRETGFCIPETIFGELPLDRCEVELAIERIVDSVPDVGELFSKLCNGELSKEETANLRKVIKGAIRD